MVERIQKIIQWKKLTASGFADQIGVPRSTISHIISGRNNPSLDLVLKILETFPEIKTDWLVRGDGHMVAIQNSLFSEGDFESSKSMPGDEKANRDSKDAKASENELSKVDMAEDIPQNSANISSSSNQRTGAVDSDEDISAHRTAVKNQKHGSRVLVLYNDGTFAEYLPLNESHS